MEGVSIAKADEKYYGRKRIAINEAKYGKILGRWRKDNITTAKTMKALGLSKSTFYRRVRDGG